MTRTLFERSEPILSVADMARSLEYYVGVLGFTNADWGLCSLKAHGHDHVTEEPNVLNLLCHRSVLDDIGFNTLEHLRLSMT